MSEHDDFFCDDGLGQPCPHCQATGWVICRCAGDLCFCGNHGEADCPVCFGEGDVSQPRYDRYRENERKNAVLMAEIWNKRP